MNSRSWVRRANLKATTAVFEGWGLCDVTGGWTRKADKININLSKIAVVVLRLAQPPQDHEAMGSILALKSYVVAGQLKHNMRLDLSLDQTHDLSALMEKR